MQVSLVSRVLEWLDEVFTGAHSVAAERRFASIAHLPGAADVSKEDLAYFSSLVCRAFGSPQKCLMPLSCLAVRSIHTSQYCLLLIPM